MGCVERFFRYLFLPPPSRRFRPDKENGAVEIETNTPDGLFKVRIYLLVLLGYLLLVISGCEPCIDVGDMPPFPYGDPDEIAGEGSSIVIYTYNCAEGNYRVLTFESRDSCEPWALVSELTGECK